MINVAVAGYGNVGRGVIKALARNPDMKFAALFSRRPDQLRNTFRDIPLLNSENFSLPEKTRIDVVILCGGSREDIPVQGPFFARQFSTVDSFDTHADIPVYFKKMNNIAKRNGNISIISAGWDPGIFSLERVYGNAFLPGSKGYTFWGPGVSQGHSDAARKISGVKDARQYTIPVENTLQKVRDGKTPDFSKRQMHKRVVYVVVEKDADKGRIKKEIVEMPHYYDEYNTEVYFISETEMAKNHSAYPHGGFVLTSDETDNGNKEVLEYRCQLQSNPEFTGSVLAACARAAFRLKEQGQKGAFTMLDIPPALFNPHPGEVLRSKFM